jgi:hypothetical protein
MKRWDTSRGRHVVEHAHGFGLGTLESLVRILPVERYACCIGGEERHADSALALSSNICYGYLTYLRFCSAPLETNEV